MFGHAHFSVILAAMRMKGCNGLIDKRLGQVSQQRQHHKDAKCIYLLNREYGRARATIR
jgi:hypothetical protein